MLVMASASQRAIRDIRSDLFAKLQTFSCAFSTSARTAS